MKAFELDATGQPVEAKREPQANPFHPANGSGVTGTSGGPPAPATVSPLDRIKALLDKHAPGAWEESEPHGDGVSWAGGNLFARIGPTRWSHESPESGYQEGTDFPTAGFWRVLFAIRGLAHDNSAPRPAARARVYVASTLTNIVAAAVLASQLRDRVDVVSTWHDQRATVEAENAMTTDDKARLAMKCFDEIDRADVFVWLHGKAGERCGAAVEYGYALKGGKIIYLVSLAGDAAPSVFGALGPEITTVALLRRLGGA